MKSARVGVALVILGTLVACGSAPTADRPEGPVAVQWLGHAAFKITTVQGKVILIDPLYYR